MNENPKPKTPLLSPNERLVQLDFEFETTRRYLAETQRQHNDVSEQMAKKWVTLDKEGIAELEKTANELLKKMHGLNKHSNELDDERAKIDVSHRKLN